MLPIFHPDGRATCGTKLLGALTERLGVQVTGLDLLCYVAAVASHPGYTARFAAQLETPGVRVPLTADAELFTRAVELGRKVVWASTYGERCADAAAGRPAGDITLPPDTRPKSLDGIPHTAEGVGGHGILNADGQVSERWRPSELNADGQRICPTRS